eukprot:CAMPEP_0194101632 /NCGR_PEP_ID=MMETSP0150-20130528/2313_1 /TAXON_ID=122233 /ORGANISM="Chaetoceros debilis, Strain MM31A-1" /LENGTH=366 /DNA_ID=CAMNT_0038788303 /DNA_START=62 /DNA_END=1162 /DNA_ORIENTATION=+
MDQQDHGYIIFANGHAGRDADDMSSCSTTSTISTLSFTIAESPSKRPRLAVVPSPQHQTIIPQQKYFVPNPIPVDALPAATMTSEKRKRGTNYCRSEIKSLLDTIEIINPKDPCLWEVVQRHHSTRWPSRDRPASSLRKKFREICCADPKDASGISKIGKAEVLRAIKIKNSLDKSIWRKLAILKQQLDATKKVTHTVSFSQQQSNIYTCQMENQKSLTGPPSTVLGKKRKASLVGSSLHRSRAFIDLTTINIPLNVPNPLSNLTSPDVPPVIQIPCSPEGVTPLSDDLDNISELGLDEELDLDGFEPEMKTSDPQEGMVCARTLLDPTLPPLIVKSVTPPPPEQISLDLSTLKLPFPIIVAPSVD